MYIYIYVVYILVGLARPSVEGCRSLPLCSRHGPHGAFFCCARRGAGGLTCVCHRSGVRRRFCSGIRFGHQCIGSLGLSIDNGHSCSGSPPLCRRLGLFCSVRSGAVGPIHRCQLNKKIRVCRRNRWRPSGRRSCQIHRWRPSRRRPCEVT